MDRESKGLRAQSRRGRIGRTWWSERWTSVLESIGLGDRLHRGRSIARAGSVRTLEVSEGEVAALVYGARQEVHHVRITMEPIPPESWDAVQEILSRQALFAARLLAGEMPQPIEEAFAEAGLSLFPAAASDLESECDCADPARPCPHAAAVFYLLAERFDQDPFLIFLFRGQGQEELLESIKQRWAQSTAGNGEDSSLKANGAAGEHRSAGTRGAVAARGAPGTQRTTGARGAEGNHGTAIDPEAAGAQRSEGRLAPTGRTGRAEIAGANGVSGSASGAGNGASGDDVADSAPPTEPAADESAEATSDPLEGFWGVRTDLEPHNPRIMAPPIPEAVVRRLGPPPGSAPDSSAEAALRHAYQIASTWALKLAMKDGNEET